mmetsp:Transcript_5871/g.12940  ORF Transcript_5871/g.12940 Transcript_5871/m.12940 type:complete len:251 (+) Transcript_5871:1362-2114(+)
MVRWAPMTASTAAPSTCADECQKTVLASGSSNLRRVRRQSPTRGLFMSHNSPSPLVPSACPFFCACASSSSSQATILSSSRRDLYATLATMTLSASPCDMPSAISMGVVLKAVPLFTLPSGRDTEMACWGLAARLVWKEAHRRSNTSMRSAWCEGDWFAWNSPPIRPPFMRPPASLLARCSSRLASGWAVWSTLTLFRSSTPNLLVLFTFTGPFAAAGALMLHSLSLETSRERRRGRNCEGGGKGEKLRS